MKPAFPDIKLGPSINKPTQVSLTSGIGFVYELWDFIDTHDVPVDFVDHLLYVAIPRTMEDRVQDSTASWENVFAHFGLPSDTELVNSERNRSISCSLESPASDTLPGGAFVAGSLIAMAGMRPANSNHNSVMSHLFFARSQIWHQNTRRKAPGVGLEAYARILIDTPEELQTTLDYTPSRTVDFRAIAGLS